MFRLVLTFTLIAGAAFAADPTAKIFVDKGSTYFRTDNKKALSVGAELVAVSDTEGKQAVGKAVVMEVNGALARVSLDDEATKGNAKFVVLPKGHSGGGAPSAAAGIIPEAGKPQPAQGPRLQGKLESSALRVSFGNDTDASWTKCGIFFSDGRSYDVGEVVKHSDDTVLKVKFKSAPEPAYDHVNVKCSEGEGQFFFSKPNEPRGSLKGYATNEGKGSIVVYNQNETAWTSCDVRKPDGTHYVLGTLKGHDNDSIDRGRFKKEDEVKEAGWVEMRCKEGVLHQGL